jgi:hypothetical protein
VRRSQRLHSPTTAIVDYPGVTRAFADRVVDGGGELRLGSRSPAGRAWLAGADYRRGADGAVVQEAFDLVVVLRRAAERPRRPAGR